MKANHELLVKAAELGILRSMPDFLEVKPGPGRLRRRYEEVGMIVDQELKKIYVGDPNFYSDNKAEMAVYLEKFGMIIGFGDVKSNVDIHIASIVSFCLCFLEETKSKYPKKLYEYLNDILDYYQRADKMEFKDFTMGVNFNDEWEKLNNG
ncbi:MAG: hypothetical protein GY797_39000 [Deltaproteobacteria bacterium]|nr:hypothetical protein [Deltaproteobacteria bacterium]